MLKEQREQAGRQSFCWQFLRNTGRQEYWWETEKDWDWIWSAGLLFEALKQPDVACKQCSVTYLHPIPTCIFVN